MAKKKGIEKKLDLNWCGYHSISAIKQLEKLNNLEELDLSGNYITEIKDLEHLTKLKKLVLSQNGISKIEGLEKLTNLEVLMIQSPQQYYEADSMMGHADAWDRDYFVPIKKIEGLDSLINLRELDLSRNEITDIMGLKNLKNIKKLILLGNKIADLKVLKHLINLEELSLVYNPAVEIKIEHVRNLKKLKICDLPIITSIKEVNINEFILVKYIYQDLSRYGKYNGYDWDFYDEFYTKQLSNHLALIFIKGKRFKRRAPIGPESWKLDRGGYKIENEEEFQDYCAKLEQWVENDYDTLLLQPPYFAYPLLKKLMKAGDPLAIKVFNEEIIKGFMSGEISVITYLENEGYFQYLKPNDFMTLIMGIESSPKISKLALKMSKEKNITKNVIKRLEIDIQEEYKADTGKDAIWRGNITKKYSDWKEKSLKSTIKIAKFIQKVQERVKIPKSEAIVIKKLESKLNQKFTLVENIEWDTKMGYSIHDNRISGLGLSDCSLSTLPASIVTLKALQILSLSNNNLKSLPNSFWGLTSLEVLSLIDNQFTTLPESIGKLKSLIQLWMSENQLQSLPKSIGDLTSLEILWLNKNQLSELPESIGNLKSLHTIGVGDNNLTDLPKSINNLKQKPLYGSGMKLPDGTFFVHESISPADIKTPLRVFLDNKNPMTLSEALKALNQKD